MSVWHHLFSVEETMPGQDQQFEQDNSSGGSRWQGQCKKLLKKEYKTEMDGSVKAIRKWSVKLQTTEDKSKETSTEQRSVQEGFLISEQGFKLYNNRWIHI